MKKCLAVIISIALMFAVLSINTLNASALTEGCYTYELANAEEDVLKANVEHVTEVPDGYVGIYTKSDLDAIRNDLNGNYILMNDIEFSDDDFSENGLFYTNGSGWTSIGNNETPFTGIFDGNGYGVNGLKITSTITDAPYVGLFGYNKGTIKNIISIAGQVDITHASNTVYVGMIAGYSEGIIENCKSVGKIHVESTILRTTYETPYSYVGGITGYSVGTLSLCENACDIQATPTIIAYAEAVAFLGGVAGFGGSSTVSNCVNSGSIALEPILDNHTGIEVYAGGILGKSDCAVEGCDNTGTVIIEEYKASSTERIYIDANFYTAGIVGNTTGTVTRSNNSGSIKARGVYAYSGGIAGYSKGILSQCANNGVIHAVSTCTGYGGMYSWACSGGIVGRNNNGTISESYNSGLIKLEEACASEQAYSGGIAAYQTGTIVNCYNSGFLTYKSYYGDTGGIAGYSGGSVSLCYNIGRVPHKGGAIVGETSAITPSCYFLNDNKTGIGKGKDTTIACSKEELLTQLAYTGFDFTTIWEIGVHDTYPCATLKNVEHKESLVGKDIFASGTGNAYDPFLIENAIQLSNIRLIPSAYYNLIADIVFTDSDYEEGGAFYNGGEGWSPIPQFMGSFDGCGHVISNLRINYAPKSIAMHESYISDHGLFGHNEGTICRVGVTGDIYVKLYDYPSTSESAYVGGIAGMSNGTIRECYFVGNIYASATYEERVGGICGWLWDDEGEGTLENCFSNGTFSGRSLVGGITGKGKYSYCYSVGQVVKYSTSTDISIIRGSGSDENHTEAEMRTQSTYTDFDFNSVWTMGGNPDYPYPELKFLPMEIVPGDINGDDKADIRDLVRLKKILLGTSQTDGVSPDVNNDGSINSQDLVFLRKYLLVNF